MRPANFGVCRVVKVCRAAEVGEGLGIDSNQMRDGLPYCAPSKRQKDARLWARCGHVVPHLTQ